MRVNGRGKNGSHRNKKQTPEERDLRKKKEGKVRAAVASFKDVTYVRKKKTRGRVGPLGKVLRPIEGNRFLVLFPHQRRPETLHVFDLDPVRFAL